MNVSPKQLGEQLNDLLIRLGRQPIKDPHKMGTAKLTERIAALQAEWDEKNPAPEYAVLENLSREELDKLIQPGRVETIRSMAERLLMYVGHVDDSDKRSVGILYRSMLALIRQKFPKAQTSLACLRWYAVHMRLDNKRLPQKRPRPPVRA